MYNLYLTGSKTLPFIENSNKDTDILVLSTETITTFSTIKHQVKEKYTDFNNIDIHFQTIDTLSYLFAYYMYLLHYIQPLEENITIELPSVFDNKKEILYRCKDLIENDVISRWYHCLINICIFENNSYDFTDEQIQEINFYYKNKKNYETLNEEHRIKLLERIKFILSVEEK